MKHWRIWLVALVIVSSVVFCADRPKEHIEHEGPYEGGPWIHPDILEQEKEAILWALNKR